MLAGRSIALVRQVEADISGEAPELLVKGTKDGRALEPGGGKPTSPAPLPPPSTVSYAVGGGGRKSAPRDD